jgi:Protein of unknown function (DUF2478)
MDAVAKTIAVVRGNSSTEVQDVFRVLVERWQISARLVGVIAESQGLADRACSAGFLRNIANGKRFSIFQDLGPGSTACHLGGLGALSAAAAVQQDIAAGCDLVLLSKFGKLEADGRGLFCAFKAALDARVPLLTSVSPAFEAPWRALCGRAFVVLPADADKISVWWQTVRKNPAPTAALASSCQRLDHQQKSAAE